VATLAGEKRHRDCVRSVAFHPTGTILATGSDDQTAKLWRFSLDGSAANNMQATCVETLQWHSSRYRGVQSVAFHPTAPLLATGSADRTAKIWYVSASASFQNRPSVSAFASGQIRPFVSASASFQNRPSVSASASFQNRPSVSASASFQNRPSVSAFASGQNRLSAAASANDSGLTIYMSNRKKVIRIEKKLLEPTGNSSNKSCPSFMPLYKKIMATNLDGAFRFEFQGQSAIDLTGLTRIVFDRLLPIYTNLFFEEDRGDEFILLNENVNIELLNQHTSQIRKLAKAAHSQIQLRINPEVLEFLSLPNPPESIATRQNFNKLYVNFKTKINMSGNNISNFLMNKTLKPQINAFQGNLDAVNRALKAEILFRKTVNAFGFKSWKQYDNMALFIKAFWNTSNENKITVTKNRREVELDLFVNELIFDVESFKRRIKIIRVDRGEIINLSSGQGALFDIYPAFQPLLKYILNPSDEANENRKTFVKYVTGTVYSPAEILIKLTNDTIHPRLFNGLPFYGHSCFNTIDLFRAPPNFKGEITQNVINTQLKATTSQNSNIRAAER
jgi:hypothetical protein